MKISTMIFCEIYLFEKKSGGGGVPGTRPPGVQILSFSCSFRPNNRLAHPLWEENPGSATVDVIITLLSPDLTNDLRDMTEICVNGLFLHDDNCMFCIICTCTYNIPVKCRMVLFK